MSPADRFLYSGASCATNAVPSSAAADPASWPPSTVALPSVGAVRPTDMFSSVVLPAPFGPTSATTCPSGTASVHSRSAHVPRYRLPSPVVSMTFMVFSPFSRSRSCDALRFAVARGAARWGGRGAHRNPAAHW